MAEYHKFVFDIENRKFVGKFEEMYRSESKQGFDSWHQEDLRQMHRIIDLVLLRDYNHDTIIDIGCGKGSFSHLLKKKNNRVLGIDISQTAIQVASKRYPDIEFFCADISNPSAFTSFCDQHCSSKIDLVLACEVLSYIENWDGLLASIAKRAEYLLLNLYLPEDPIGFVKNEEQLISELEKHYETVEWITVQNRRFTIFLGKSRKVDEDCI